MRDIDVEANGLVTSRLVRIFDAMMQSQLLLVLSVAGSVEMKLSEAGQSIHGCCSTLGSGLL